nr:phosphotransferase [uncultured Mucilaginibacter sp.]
MIPEEKKAALTRALNDTFGINDFEDISHLNAGLSSALVYKITVLGKPYLLKIITRTDAMADPTNQYTCVRDAAAAGIAPKVWYTNVHDRISITDFVDAKPFPISEAKVKMPLLLKRLHAMPPFRYQINYLDIVDGFIQKLRDAKILPESITGELFDQYARLREVYPRGTADWVASHNDLKPENILFDGERPLLVDWEAVFLNDPYFDLAVVANFVITNEAEEKDYLTGYLGKVPTEYQLARFFLMQQIVHVAYFTFFMRLVHEAGAAIDPDAARPDFRKFNKCMWEGGVDLNDTDNRLQYARAHMGQLQHNFELERFEESLRIVAAGH